MLVGTSSLEQARWNKLVGTSSLEQARWNKLVDYVATRPIGELFCGVERMSGSANNRMFWSNQVIATAEQEEADVE